MAQVAGAARSSRAVGGVPDTDAMLRAADLNGDGGEDWIVDYRKLQCAGRPNPFCGTGGCSLQVFLWSQGADWKLAVDTIARSYHFQHDGRSSVLLVQRGGLRCAHASAGCLHTYRFPH